MIAKKTKQLVRRPRAHGVMVGNAMMTGHSTPPTTQRVFSNSWDELEYVRKKIRYWLFTRGLKIRADRYVERLQRVLDELPENNLAISREEGLALLFQLTGNLSKAITHRKREIELIERLQREAQLPRYDEKTRRYMLSDLDDAALKQRRDVLRRLKEEKADQNGNGVFKTR